ncbi:hypothetical protein [Taklimakanibacter deserti]|uniref:hypothetical protein n=1 Tax=Taklimakanibacter deserti TaxID=2267839 RepID=UPI000E647B0F
MTDGVRASEVINTRYKKLSGMHAGHSFVVVAPYGEIETPMRWMLHMEGAEEEKFVVAENELADRKIWQPLG